MRPSLTIRTAFLIAFTGILLWITLIAIAAPIEAHCPGGAAGYRYAVGAVDFTTGKSGVRGWIGYVNPNPCTNSSGNAFSAEWLTLGRTTSFDGWVQVGMIKRQGWSAPRYFCEFTGNNGFWHLHDGTTSITATTHHYRFSNYFSEGATHWECQYDSAPIFHTHTTNELGWASGVQLQAGGEAYAPHGQIGTNAPAKLGFTVLQHRSGTVWSTSNYAPATPLSPYGIDEPAVGELRNWTNAH